MDQKQLRKQYCRALSEHDQRKADFSAWFRGQGIKQMFKIRQELDDRCEVAKDPVEQLAYDLACLLMDEAFMAESNDVINNTTEE